MHNLSKRILASGFAVFLVAMVLVPMAQASHFQWYFNPNVPDNHASMGTFEPNADTSPTGEIPPQFQGLTDRLVTTHGFAAVGDHPTTQGEIGDGSMVFDFFYQEGPAPSANVPVNYYLAKYSGDESLDNRLTGFGSFWAWHGYWWDVTGDGVIDEEYSFDPERASQTDEWIWRGIGTNESTVMVGYLFPSDRTVELGGADGFFVPAWGDAGQTEPRGFAGNCNRFAEEDGYPNCWEPRPDISMTDRTNTDAGQGNQQWLAESGWNDQFLEEDLITGLHVFGLVGGNPVSGPEKYDVDCSNSGETCAYDYDYYEALAGSDVSNLYTTTMSIPRDEVWQNEDFFRNGVTDDVTGGYTIDRYRQELTRVDACPWKPAEYLCAQDTSHLDAEKDDTGQSNDRVGASVVATSPLPFPTNVGGDFEQYWCDTATQQPGNPQCDGLTGHGVYGGFPDSIVELEDGATTAEEGVFIAANVFAWRWTDTNGDGYIGAPTPAEVDNYEAGLTNSPNNGFCTTGDVCEISGHAVAFAGKYVRVAPCETPVNGACSDGAWPPGTFVSRVYDRFSEGQPFYPASQHAWYEQSTPAFGGNSVDLRTDDQGCSGEAIGCRTKDAVFIPGGSHTTLNGVSLSVGSGMAFGDFVNGASPTFAPGVSFSWDEGETTYTKTYASLTDYAEAGAFGLL